jgi:hypothetical protein
VFSTWGINPSSFSLGRGLVLPMQMARLSTGS